MPRVRSRRRLHTSPEPRTCGRCKGEIPAGTEFHRDVSGTGHHPACVRLGVRPSVSEPRREPSVVRLVEQERLCVGCGYGFDPGERIDHVLGKPWHRGCRV